MPVSVAIVEDNPEIAEYLEEIINSFDGFKVLFKAFNGKELVEKLKLHQPELIIMDIQMPVMNGIEAIKFVKESHPLTKIIMHTVVNNDEAILESIMLGANGYILKNEKPAKLIDAINDVLNGGAPITPSIAQKLIKYLQYKNNKPSENNFQLSERELEILSLISQGLSYKLIANKLFISSKTVGKHIENIYAKLHVNNKVDAINLFRDFLRK